MGHHQNSTKPPAAELAQFSRICGMLGSEHAGEVLSAASMATKWLRTRDLCWEDVLRPALPPPSYQPRRQPPPPPPRSTEREVDWTRLAGACLAKALADDLWLSDWERRFLADIPNVLMISPRQAEALTRIALRLGVRP